MYLISVFCFISNIFKSNFQHAINLNYIGGDPSNMDLFDKFEFASLKNNSIMQKIYLDKINNLLKSKKISKNTVLKLNETMQDYYDDSQDYFRQADEALDILEKWDALDNNLS